MKPSTAADRRAYLESGLRPVECLRCGNRVLARKNSPQHTSIQWTSDSVASCPEFAARAENGGSAALISGCTGLRESIDAAVRAGELEVGGHD